MMFTCYCILCILSLKSDIWTVLDICRFTVDVAVTPSCLYNSLEEKLNHDFRQTCFYKDRSAAKVASNVQNFWSALQGHSKQRKDTC